MILLGFCVILSLVVLFPIAFPEVFAFVESVPCPSHLMCNPIPILVVVALVLLGLYVFVVRGDEPKTKGGAWVDSGLSGIQVNKVNNEVKP